MRRGPVTAAVVPVVLGLVFLYGATMVVALIAEHRLWTASLEVSWVLVAGVGALIITYLVALLAMGAVFIRSRYNRLLTLHQTMRDIRNMSWTEFEELVAANYAAQGYEVDRVGQAGPDGGIDLGMRKEWRNRARSVQALSQQLGARTAAATVSGLIRELQCRQGHIRELRCLRRDRRAIR
jgi:hypothetical protein